MHALMQEFLFAPFHREEFLFAPFHSGTEITNNKNKTAAFSDIIIIWNELTTAVIQQYTSMHTSTAPSTRYTAAPHRVLSLVPGYHVPRYDCTAVAMYSCTQKS